LIIRVIDWGGKSALSSTAAEERVRNMKKSQRSRYTSLTRRSKPHGPER